MLSFILSPCSSFVYFFLSWCMFLSLFFMNVFILSLSLYRWLCISTLFFVFLFPLFNSINYQVKTLSQKTLDLLVQGRSLLERLFDEDGEFVGSFPRHFRVRIRTAKCVDAGFASHVVQDAVEVFGVLEIIKFIKVIEFIKI